MVFWIIVGVVVLVLGVAGFAFDVRMRRQGQRLSADPDRALAEPTAEASGRRASNDLQSRGPGGM